MVDLHLNHYSKANTHCNEIADLPTHLEQPQARSKRGKFSSSELGQQGPAACDDTEEALAVETPAMKLDEAIKKFASSYSCDNCIFSFERVLQDREVVRAASALQYSALCRCFQARLTPTCTDFIRRKLLPISRLSEFVLQ